MQSGEETSLSSLTIEITNSCYLSCIHCSTIASRDSSERLPLSTIQQVINDWKSLGGKTIEISGGEPLLYPNLLKVIEYAKDKGMETCLFSCGVFNTPGSDLVNNELDIKIHKLKKAGLDKVFVSLHGSNAEYHNEVAQTEVFRHTTNFIRKLVEEDFYVGIHFVPLAINFESLQDITEYVAELGCREIGFLRFVPQGRGALNREMLTLSKDESLELIETLSEKLTSSNIEVRVGSHLDFCFLFIPGHRPKCCNAGIKKCLVTAKGKVIPCAVFKGLPEYVAGNVNESRLSQIWRNSPVFEELRNFNPKHIKGECAKCHFLNVCEGRCPAQRVYDWGDLYRGPDKYCPKEALEQGQNTTINPNTSNSTLQNLGNTKDTKVVLCGSYGNLNRFLGALRQLKETYSSDNVFPTKDHLKESKSCIEAHHGGKGETAETLTRRSELMMEYFRRIDDADLVVILNEKEGKEYYGVGTMIELGYAVAKKKKIVFVRKPSDSNILSLQLINEK